MKLSPFALLAGGLVMCGAGALAVAQIRRLDLTEMVTLADNAVVGTITGREVIRIDDPTDGIELYYTSLTIEGHSLYNNQPLTATVWFGGGFVDAEHGVHNSEAPSDDDQKVGNKVVAFYRWNENMGGQHSGNSLVAWHGGLYRTIDRRDGKVIVQGRGDGYAIPTNVELGGLTQQVAHLAQTK